MNIESVNFLTAASGGKSIAGDAMNPTGNAGLPNDFAIALKGQEMALNEGANPSHELPIASIKILVPNPENLPKPPLEQHELMALLDQYLAPISETTTNTQEAPLNPAFEGAGEPSLDAPASQDMPEKHPLPPMLKTAINPGSAPAVVNDDSMEIQGGLAAVISQPGSVATRNKHGDQEKQQQSSLAENSAQTANEAVFIVRNSHDGNMTTTASKQTFPDAQALQNARLKSDLPSPKAEATQTNSLASSKVGLNSLAAGKPNPVVRNFQSQQELIFKPETPTKQTDIAALPLAKADPQSDLPKNKAGNVQDILATFSVENSSQPAPTQPSPVLAEIQAQALKHEFAAEQFQKVEPVKNESKLSPISGTNAHSNDFIVPKVLVNDETGQVQTKAASDLERPANFTANVETAQAKHSQREQLPPVKEALNKLIPSMVRQAHHERNQVLGVRPEPVEGFNQSFLKIESENQSPTHKPIFAESKPIADARDIEGMMATEKTTDSPAAQEASANVTSGFEAYLMAQANIVAPPPQNRQGKPIPATEIETLLPLSEAVQPIAETSNIKAMAMTETTTDKPVPLDSGSNVTSPFAAVQPSLVSADGVNNDVSLKPKQELPEVRGDSGIQSSAQAIPTQKTDPSVNNPASQESPAFTLPKTDEALPPAIGLTTLAAEEPKTIKAEAAAFELRSEMLTAPKATEARMESFAIAKPLTHPDWGRDVGEQVMWLYNKDISAAEIKLNPPHLGPISVRIDVNQDNQASILFSAQHLETREALEAAVPKLREMLHGQQVELANVNVSNPQPASSNTSGLNSNTGRSQPQFFQDGFGHNGSNQETIGNTPDSTETLQVVGKGLLSLYA